MRVSDLDELRFATGPLFGVPIEDLALTLVAPRGPVRNQPPEVSSC